LGGALMRLASYAKCVAVCNCVYVAINLEPVDGNRENTYEN